MASQSRRARMPCCRQDKPRRSDLLPLRSPEALFAGWFTGTGKVSVASTAR